MKDSLIEDSDRSFDRINESLISEQRESNLYKMSFQSSDNKNLITKTFSLMLFQWINPLLYGLKNHHIEQKLIPQLDSQLKAETEYERLNNIFKDVKKSKRQGWRIVKSLLIAYKCLILGLGVLFAMIVGARMYSPILTQQVIIYVQNKDKQSNEKGIILVFIVLVIIMLQSLAESQVNFQLSKLGITISNSISMMIYKKALKYQILYNKQYSVSDIVNRSQTDAQRLTQIGPHLTSLVFIPIQLIISVFLIYYYIGISFLSGVGVLIGSLTLTIYLSRLSAGATQQLLIHKDKRLNIIQQSINMIKFVKYNAMEKYFFNKINHKRSEEIKSLKKINHIFALEVLLFWTCTPLILFATFGTMILLQAQITSTLVFSTIILFRLMENPLWDFPISISEIIQIYKSLKRIQRFLQIEEIQTNIIQNDISPQLSSAVVIKNGTFQWQLNPQSKQKEPKEQKQKLQDLLNEQNHHQNTLIALKNINLVIPKGKLIMVTGQVGSGKSSLIFAILSQIKSHQGTYVEVNGKISYVQQKPWIKSQTLLKNIIFNQQYNQVRFNQALHFSQLQADIELMVDGYNTQIGEKGVNLSGGQKTRVSLARALYSNSDIYLFDDLLSAVDAYVANFLIKDTICGYLKGKTIILVTHALEHIHKADLIIFMKNGNIQKYGTYEEIRSLQAYKNLQKNEQIGQKQITEQSLSPRKLMKQLSLIKLKPNEPSDKVVTQLTLAEQHQRGSIGVSVFVSYVRMNGGIKFVMVTGIFLVGWLGLYAMSSIFVEKWCEDPSNQNYYFYIFTVLGLMSSIFSYLRIYSFSFPTINQAVTIHKKITKSLLYASITHFYNRVPVGRIINRLTKDLREVDQKLGMIHSYFFICVFYLIGDLILCSYASTPWIIIPFLVVSGICYKFLVYYLSTFREIVRFINITNSPIVSGFMSTINGLPTIRAYKVQKYYIAHQFSKININKRIRICKAALEGWFYIRISLLAVIINSLTISYCLFSSNLNGSLAGLLLAYTLTLNQDILSVGKVYTQLESKMISYQRILSFVQIKPEEGYEQYCEKWWTKDEGYNKQLIKIGQIEFINYSVRYRKELPYVLKDINLHISPTEKIGIVGRTGAGKSTIIQCILRVLESQDGSILIDGVDIRNYGLKDLRSSITIIQQQPTIFQGTFRQNLDYQLQYTDQELETIIDECKIRQIVKKRGGIDSRINFDALSAGQKQLICLCRAFLKKSKIILIDQATANIDETHDNLIQKLIWQKFKNSTVLTIAHRLTTLKNYDKILVMGEGRVLEWGTPQMLIKKDNGIYKQMLYKNNKQYLK